MKQKIVGLICLLCLLLASCKTDLPGVGGGLLGSSDTIVVCGDTFALASSIDTCQSIISSPDSFLLGELETDYGIVRADLLTQLACPEGFHYPENAVIDSLCMVMYYRDWIGDGMSPLAISMYTMDRQGLKYISSKPYTTSVELSDYCSLEDSTVVLYNERVVLAGHKTDSVYNTSTGSYVPRVRFSIDSNSAFARRFMSIRSFESQQEFNDEFRGLYVTTSFGSSTMLHVIDMSLVSYYHFSYRKLGSEQDTVVNDTKSFYINSEVRQINRVHYSDRSMLVNSLRQDANTNYIIAPSGVCTRVSLPIRSMRESMLSHLVSGGDTLRPYINKAELRIRVLNADNKTGDRERWLSPAGNMLLVREASQERFFANRELPNDTVAIVSSLQKGTDKEGNTIYYYRYLLNDLLTSELRHPSDIDSLCMVLVPVSVGTATTESGLTLVRQSQEMTATAVVSASSPEHPMDLEVIYSGF